MFRWLLPALIGSMFLSACKKEQQTGVPPVGVDITLNVNLPEFANLQIPGGWVYLTGGAQGIIVYRQSIDQFTALDRHCPHDNASTCRATVDESNVLATDTTCCGSQYLLFDGSVSQGPSVIALKRYNTLWNGTTLRIYN